jgi:O-succinylbenzoic acid--CoA ligase
MTPLQVYNSLQVPEEKERLCRIEILLIGGGAIGPDLEKEIRKLPNEIYSTYGMTETLSHIALRRLNGKNPSPYYTPFPSVSLSLSADQTLVIDAPEVSREKVVTNDLAELLPDGRFRMIGRKDNTINSGGIKIQTEALEEKLRPYIPFPFAITSIPDAGLGEAIALLSEEEITDDLRQRINETLHKYERPRHIGQIPAIPLTASGKIDRHTCRETAIRLLLH